MTASRAKVKVKVKSRSFQDDVKVGWSISSYGVLGWGRRFLFRDRRASRRAVGASGLPLLLLRPGVRRCQKWMGVNSLSG